MKLVKENINEGAMPSEKIQEIKAETLTYLREKIFPKLDYDELVDYLKVMRTWFDSNIY